MAMLQHTKNALLSSPSTNIVIMVCPCARSRRTVGRAYGFVAPATCCFGIGSQLGLSAGRGAGCGTASVGCVAANQGFDCIGKRKLSAPAVRLHNGPRWRVAPNAEVPPTASARPAPACRRASWAARGSEHWALLVSAGSPVAPARSH
jgi:hypothetical protein